MIVNYILSETNYYYPYYYPASNFVPIMMVIIVMVRINRLINQFKETGTISYQSAKTLEELSIKPRFIFNRFVKREVIIEATNERFYLNLDNLKIYSKERRVRMLVISGILILIMLIETFLIH